VTALIVFLLIVLFGLLSLLYGADSRIDERRR
jgi:hypothetical protein